MPRPIKKLLQLNYKIDICSGCENIRPIINRKYMMCQNCNYVRLHGEQEKRKRVKPVSDRRKERISSLEFDFSSETDLFTSIWNSREHKSEVSGDPLPFDKFTPDWFKCFSHLLPKGSYSLWRLNPDNILLKTPEEHWAWHNIPRSELEKIEIWKPIFKRYDESRIDYNRRYKSGR